MKHEENMGNRFNTNPAEIKKNDNDIYIVVLENSETIDCEMVFQITKAPNLEPTLFYKQIEIMSKKTPKLMIFGKRNKAE